MEIDLSRRFVAVIKVRDGKERIVGAGMTETGAKTHARENGFKDVKLYPPGELPADTKWEPGTVRA